MLLLLLACNQAPTVQITAPAEGDQLLLGNLSTFTAQISDDKGIQTVTWTANGAPITGESALTTTTASLSTDKWLPLGDIQINARAVDASGLFAEDQITITIVENAEPIVSFLSPTADAQVPVGLSVDIQAQITDPNETDPSLLSLSWQGATGPEHPDTTGLATGSITPEAEGFFTVTLSATDPQGRNTSAVLSLQAFNVDNDGDGESDISVGGTDCDDTDPTIYAAATEHCDGRDENCNGLIDDNAADANTWYADNDGDGWGANNGSLACTQPTGALASNGDCDDNNANIYQGAPEQCDGLDDDCDGSIPLDESNDNDGDTYLGCEDCDDNNSIIYPGSTEICDANNQDEDCDGLTDDNDTSVDTSGFSTFYRDADGDGYGVSSPTTQSCDAPTGYANQGGDCADTSATISPVTPEICGDGVDNNCDGLDPRCTPSGTDTLSNADIVYQGETALDYAGATVVMADTDGDGDQEILIGAWGYGSTDTGAFYVVAQNSSASGGSLATEVRLTGITASDAAGYAVLGVPDMDGDGDQEVLVGAYAADDGGNLSGSSYLLYGPLSSGSLSTANAKLIGDVMGDASGYALGSGDTDGDGLQEMLMGATGNDRGGSNAGAVYLVENPSGNVDLSTASAIFVGENTGDNAGHRVIVGDLNGDGMEDVLVGATGADPNGSASGAVYLYVGPVSGVLDLSLADAIWEGAAADDQVGDGLGLGDFDDDGLVDVLLGASLVDNSAGASNAGVIYVLSAASASGVAEALAYASIEGEDADDRLGTTSGIGDVNGDGSQDLLVGAWYDETAGAGAGTSYLFYGPLSGTISASAADWEGLGSSSRDNAGLGVALGDIDGDGFADILVGAQLAGVGGEVYGVWGGGS